MAKSKFETSVAWVYASLGTQTDSPDGTDLCSLIAAGDMMNHAILTLGEIVSACETLSLHGLVDFKNGRICLTPHGRTVSEDGFRRRGGLFSTIDKMRKALNKFDHPVVDREPDLSFLTESELNNAYQEYRAWSD
ncbi:MAG: hypothetical protein H8E66_16885 [Planctomycetes bacterium]|nr:hypothetical protein [Planctomycetota bacterium]